MGNCCASIANLLYYAQKISYCIALLAVTICLLVTLVVTLGVGIGMGYHYAVVEHTSLELKQLANGTGKSLTPASSSSNQNNVFYYRRKSPLATGNLTEEEVPIQRYRTYHRRRRNGFKLNSSHLVSRLPELFKLTTIRTANTFSTMFDKNTTKKITELLNFTISATENIRSETTQFLGKKYTSKVIWGKEYSGHNYGKSKDELLTTDQKQKQLYFLKSLIQIYQKLMPNSSSSTHL